MTGYRLLGFSKFLTNCLEIGDVRSVVATPPKQQENASTL